MRGFEVTEGQLCVGGVPLQRLAIKRQANARGAPSGQARHRAELFHTLRGGELARMAQIGRGIGGGSNHRHGRHHGVTGQRGGKGLLGVGSESWRQGNASQRNAGGQTIQREESRHSGKGAQKERRNLAGGM